MSTVTANSAIIPWMFLDDVAEDDRIFHWRMIFVAVVLAFITMMSQWRQPAPYGRFDPKDGKWGPQVQQRISHVLNDGLWGVLYFSLMYFYYGKNQRFSVNLVFVVAWLAHFAQRGFIHPVIMQYSSRTIPLGIPITGLTLAFFSHLHAKFLSMISYKEAYVTDYRFMVGMAFFVFGYFVNRASDYQLRCLRLKSGNKKYQVPRGILFKWISCPNYLGEMLEWFGWAMATWTPCGFAYFVFTAATFIPRAKHTHLWYHKKFKNYPRDRKAIIPFIF